MFVNSENWEDVRKYYHQTFVKFKETGDTIWFIKEVHPDKLICTDKQEEVVAIDLEIGYNIDYVMPKKTIFQYGSTASILFRIPARMWKKGINKQNTSFEVLSGSGIWSSLSFNLSLLEGFVNKPLYLNTSAILENFKKEDSDLISAAISPRIAILRGGKIFIDKIMVAKLDLEKNVLLTKKIFASDIAPYFPNQTMKVV